MRHSVMFLSIVTTGVTASLVLTGCSTDEDTSPQPSAPATTTLSTVSALNDWQPESLPQPVTRLGTTAPSAPDSPEPEPERMPEAPPAQASQNAAPAPQVQTVTVQAPAPKPAPQNPPKAPKQPQNPQPGLPTLPAPPTIQIPQEVQDGLAQIPTLPPLPRAEDIYIDVPF